MSEEEQIKAAIAASLGKDDSEEAEVAAVAAVENPVQPTAAEQEEDTKEVSKLDAIQAVKRDEPTDMENSTRIQLRMADGKRVIRRFMKTDPVQYLFEFVKAEFPEAQTRPFEASFWRSMYAWRTRDSCSQRVVCSWFSIGNNWFRCWISRLQKQDWWTQPWTLCSSKVRKQQTPTKNKKNFFFACQKHKKLDIKRLPFFLDLFLPWTPFSSLSRYVSEELLILSVF